MGRYRLLALACMVGGSVLAACAVNEAPRLSAEAPKAGMEEGTARLIVKLPPMPGAPAPAGQGPRRLQGTPTYVASIVVTVLQAGQSVRQTSIARWWSNPANPSLEFGALPAGPTILRAEAFGPLGERLGDTEQSLVLGVGQQSTLNLTIPLTGVISGLPAETGELEAALVQGNLNRGQILSLKVNPEEAGSGPFFLHPPLGFNSDGDGGFYYGNWRCIIGNAGCNPSSASYYGRIDKLGKPSTPYIAMGFNGHKLPIITSKNLGLIAFNGAFRLSRMSDQSRIDLRPTRDPITGFAFDDDGGILAGSSQGGYRVGPGPTYALSELTTMGPLVAGRNGPGWWSCKGNEWRIHGAAGDLVSTGNLPIAPHCLYADGAQGLWLQAWGPSANLGGPIRMIHLDPTGQLIGDRASTDATNMTVDERGQAWSIGARLEGMASDASVIESYPIWGNGLAPGEDTLLILQWRNLVEVAL